MKQLKTLSIIMALLTAAVLFVGCSAGTGGDAASVTPTQTIDSKMPKGYPLDEFPLCDVALILPGAPPNQTAETGYSLQYESKAGALDVVKFYEDKLGEPTSNQTDDSIGQTILEWEKPLDGKTFTFAIAVRDKNKANDYGAKSIVMAFIVPAQKQNAAQPDTDVGTYPNSVLPEESHGDAENNEMPTTIPADSLGDE